MRRVVNLEDGDGVLHWLDEALVCYVFVYAKGPDVRVVCDIMQYDYVILCNHVNRPLVMENALLNLLKSLVVFVCALYTPC